MNKIVAWIATRYRHLLAVLLLLVAVSTLRSIALGADQPPPNILLVVMDDIGIDQWGLFGYGGVNPASTPNIDAVAKAGVRFHNMWSMPACSNGRAAVFTGRYPFRTHALTAIGSNDLVNYMVNPNEMTIPRILKQRGYKSALFGKFHLGIQTTDPYGFSMVQSLGWDYFDGWLDDTGDPSSIDSTAGGQYPKDKWKCGFIQDAANGGADTGACYAAGGVCQVMTIAGPGKEAPGRICRDSGGLFVADQPCQSQIPSGLDFTILSGHYVSPLVINNEDGSVVKVAPTDIRARTYRGIEVVDAAISWINQQPKTQPWMASVAFATAHSPVMQPPSQLLPPSEPDSSNLDCTNPVAQGVITDEMTEALDSELGRLLVSIGVATRGSGGQIVYNKQSNTYVILVTDNGSTGSIVKQPFDGSRAKSTAYQTGVWVPGIVTGPEVKRPGRSVNAMTNIVDLFQLFGEVAGVDVHQSVPWTVDSESMLPYLRNPARGYIRKTNFTQIGTNLGANGAINGPCEYGQGVCTQIAPTKGVCEDNNGTWWGAGASDPSTQGIPPEGFKLCCEVAIWQHDHPPQTIANIYPLEAMGMRNKNYKLVVNSFEAYDEPSNSCVPLTTTEFYKINEDVPTPMLDEAGDDLLTSGKKLTAVQQRNFKNLSAELKSLLATQPACASDINLDGVVNYLDISDWANLEALSGGLSSWADINQDGLTDDADLAIILANQGQCPSGGNALERGEDLIAPGRASSAEAATSRAARVRLAVAI